MDTKPVTKLFERYDTPHTHRCRECGREFQTTWKAATCCFGCTKRGCGDLREIEKAKRRGMA
jgi:hypothetical protein